MKHLLGIIVLFVNFTAFAQTNVLFTITNAWRYNQTQNLDTTNWKAFSYNDLAWPSGKALLYVESSSSVSPKNTALTLGRTTYYFRTSFNFTGAPPNFVLSLSNRIDDGAVFYLNGTEIQRVRMPTTAITYATLATDTPPGGDATGWDNFTIAATNLLIGSNVLAVEVHQSSSTSSDIVFGSALAIKPPTTDRGPYLQSGSSTNVTVRWRTDGPTNSVFHYGLDTNLTTRFTNSTLQADHEITLSNLLPDTKYYYAVGSSSYPPVVDTNCFFITAPIPGTPKPTRIWVIGDAGTADSNQAAVRNAYENFTGTRYTDLWLMLGDNAYNDGTDAEYQAAVFQMYPLQLQQSVVWPALGNHDTDQSTSFHDNYPYFKIFTLPTNGVAGGEPSGTEHYYSFDYANIHFVCLDSMTASRATNGAMANWLRLDLAANLQPWVIAFWHHPAYTKGSHDSDTESALVQMRTNFLPILDSYGVDLVLAGHSHSYERSYLINGHYGLSTSLTSNMVLNAGSGRTNDPFGPYTKWATGSAARQGAVYAVAGSSGKTEAGPLNHPAMYVSVAQLGSMIIDVEGNRLTSKFLRENGTVIDEFTIVKEDVEFSSIQPAAGGFQLQLTNVAAGKSNILQTSLNLSNWTSISTNLSRSNRMQLSHTNLQGADATFYRILRAP